MLVDLDAKIPENVVKEIESNPAVIRVRVFQ